MFWSLVSSGPQRIIRPDAAVTADMKGQHVVNVHECWYLGDDGMIAEVSLAPQQSDMGPVSLAIHDLTLEQLKQVRIWDIAETSALRLAGQSEFCDAHQSFLPSVLHAINDAGRGGYRPINASPLELEVLDAMQQANCAQGPPWYFTEHGRRELRVGMRLEHPRLVLTAPGDTMDLRSAGVHELLTLMEVSGWMHQVARGARDVRRAQRYW